MESPNKKIGMIIVLLITFLNTLGAMPSFALPDKHLNLEVTPATISFNLLSPDQTGYIGSSQEVSVVTYHGLGRARKWNVFINSVNAHLVGPFNQLIPITNLEWSTDGIIYNKLTTGRALVKSFEAPKNVLCEVKVFYRLFIDKSYPSGAYSVTINFDALWGEAYTDLE